MFTLRDWRLKGMIQRVLSGIPGGDWLNDQIQLTLGELRSLDLNVARKVDDWCGLMACLQNCGRAEVTGKTILEIGTGWYPVLPLCFALAGARSVHTVDVARHMKKRLILKLLPSLAAHLPKIAEYSDRSLEEIAHAYQGLMSSNDPVAELLHSTVQYLAPQDASSIKWAPNGSFDLIFSNSVLEHVPARAIAPIMRESHRLLATDGLILHAVACNDHYANFDRRISFVNYLSYDERSWRRWNNRIQFQNRLRAPDFIRLAEESGFRIIYEARATRSGVEEAISRMVVAPMFEQYSLADLTVTSVSFVADKGRA